MSEERRDEQGRDWSQFDPHDSEREARRAERDARDAAREAERDARRSERDAERSERDAARAEWHAGGMPPGGFGMPYGFNAAEFAKRFMRDFASDASGESYSETLNAEFPFEHMPRLRIRNISGETAIRVGEAGKIVVVARKHVTASSEDRAKRLLQNLELRMEKHGDELRIEPHLYEQERGWVDLFRGKRFRVDFEVTVPEECAVDAETVSGDLSLAGVRGPLELQTVSGDVSIADAQGPLRLKSVSGDVSCERYVGHVDGNTVSGDVTFESARIRSSELHTVSGDIEVRGALESGRDHRFRTISGDVDLDLCDADLNIDFRTASGDLEAEIATRVTRLGRKEYQIQLGAGSGRAYVKTVSGDLTVAPCDVEVPGEPSTVGPATATSDASDANADVERTEPMAAAAPDEEIRSVLERLAKGELNVDAAAAAIDEARKER